MSPSSSLIGKPAPDFTVTSSDGESFTLSSILKKAPIALFFFPQAGTSVCDAEACSFEKTYPVVGAETSGVTVIGVSYSSPEQLKIWKEKHKLSYLVLSDEARTARDTYRVGKLLFGATEARATFFIDGEGIVRGVLDGTLALLSSQKHVDFITKWVAQTKA